MADKIVAWVALGVCVFIWYWCTHVFAYAEGNDAALWSVTILTAVMVGKDGGGDSLVDSIVGAVKDNVYWIIGIFVAGVVATSLVALLVTNNWDRVPGVLATIVLSAVTTCLVVGAARKSV